MKVAFVKVLHADKNWEKWDWEIGKFEKKTTDICDKTPCLFKLKFDIRLKFFGDERKGFEKPDQEIRH